MGIHHGPSAPPKRELRQINLLRGWPNPSLLPTAAIAHASQTAFSDPEISTPGLLYAPDPGYQPLRQEISKWLSTFYSIYASPSVLPQSTSSLPSIPITSTAPAAVSPLEALQPDPERICITGGASQNLACILQVFTDPVTTDVWMVAPCYFLACRIFEDAGLKLRAVPEGETGLDLEWLERGLSEAENRVEKEHPLKPPKPWAKFYKHIIYLVPTFSNPSGKTMPLTTRQNLVRLARKYDALIVTDDVYDFLQWPTISSTSSSTLTHAAVPRLVDVDRTLEPLPEANSFGHAVSNGSFSKIVGPGVRTGWAEATPKFAYGLSQCGSSRSGGAPSQLVATFIAQMLKNGSLQRHIQNILCPAYQKRYEIVLEAIKRCLLPLGVKLGETTFGENKIFGGYFLWLKLAEPIGAEVVERAREGENLIVSPGKVFEVNGDGRCKFEREIRLCFAWVEEEDLVEGVERLARVVQMVLSSRDSDLKVGKEEGRDLGEFQ